jgi:hypothetical protein
MGIKVAKKKKKRQFKIDSISRTPVILTYNPSYQEAEISRIAV